jgi:hypothetical protein
MVSPNIERGHDWTRFYNPDARNGFPRATPETTTHWLVLHDVGCLRRPVTAHGVLFIGIAWILLPIVPASLFIHITLPRRKFFQTQCILPACEFKINKTAADGSYHLCFATNNPSLCIRWRKISNCDYVPVGAYNVRKTPVRYVAHQLEYNPSPGTWTTRRAAPPPYAITRWEGPSSTGVHPFSSIMVRRKPLYHKLKADFCRITGWEYRSTLLEFSGVGAR